MGAWSEQILDNDVASDVHSAFLEKYENGMSMATILSELKEENEDALEDVDDMPQFWLAVAQAQWECGALQPKVLTKVTEIIDKGLDMHNWIEAGEESAKKRQEVLSHFLFQLQQPNPAPHKRKRKPAKKRNYSEGDWFAVPIEPGYVLGRIARVGKRGGVLLGYFFKPLLTDIPTVEDTMNLTAHDAFHIAQFGHFGLIDDGWPIIHNPDAWNRDEWPMPPFGSITVYGPGFGSVARYDEDDLCICLNESPTTAEKAMQFPKDGLGGHIYLRDVLEDYFTRGQRPYDPNDRLHSPVWFQGLPKAGMP